MLTTTHGIRPARRCGGRPRRPGGAATIAPRLERLPVPSVAADTVTSSWHGPIMADIDLSDQRNGLPAVADAAVTARTHHIGIANLGNTAPPVPGSAQLAELPYQTPHHLDQLADHGQALSHQPRQRLLACDRQHRLPGGLLCWPPHRPRTPVPRTRQAARRGPANSEPVR